MGQIIPFANRTGARAGFSAEERARLAELAERYAAAGVRVEVIYGATEDGDPWCVVKDEEEEVLIHVARIGDTFVVHYALEDALRQGQDLRSVLHDRLAWDERPEVVVPFSRQAQSLLALIVAASFFHDTARDEDAVPASGPAPVEPEPAYAVAAGDGPPNAPAGADHAPPHPEGLALMSLGGVANEPVRPPLWSDSDDDLPLLRVDHGAVEPARFAPGGPVGPIANLQVATTPALEAPRPMMLAFNARPHAAAAPAPEAAVSGFASLTATRRDEPAASHPPAPEHPEAAVHWVEIDTDGDGRPDTRVVAPGAAGTGKTEPAILADHAAILAVGHGFPHGEMV